MLPGAPSLTSATTSASSATKFRSSQPPMNPVAPVTKVGLAFQNFSDMIEFLGISQLLQTCSAPETTSMEVHLQYASGPIPAGLCWYPSTSRNRCANRYREHLVEPGEAGRL